MRRKRLPFPVPSSPGLAPSISLSLGEKRHFPSTMQLSSYCESRIKLQPALALGFLLEEL